MDIEYQRYKLVPLSNLDFGEVFLYQSQLFLQARENFNTKSVCLATGRIYIFPHNEKVQRVKGKFIVQEMVP